MRTEMYWCVLGVVVMGTLFMLPADGQDCCCEWELVFKAVQGNNRNVRDDFLSGGAINENNATAKDISSTLPFRNATILDNWYQLDIEKVKVEVYANNVRESWFQFDGRTSTIETWFSKDSLTASPYTNIRDIPDTGSGAFWSIDGAPTNARHFYINQNYGGCPNDCGYLVVVDPGNSNCAWMSMESKPYFLYGKKTDSCSKSQTPGETGVGDRFAISVQVCPDP